ncbi:hypothetical protein ACFQXA_07545 [Nocardiopsis composta]
MLRGRAIDPVAFGAGPFGTFADVPVEDWARPRAPGEHGAQGRAGTDDEQEGFDAVRR